MADTAIPDRLDGDRAEGGDGGDAIPDRMHGDRTVVAMAETRIRAGDLFMIRGTSLTDGPVKLVTGSPYTHVAGYVSGTRIIEAQGLRKTGYQKMHRYQGVTDIFTCDELTADQRFTIIRYVLGELGGRYDYWLIVWELVRHTAGLMLPYNPGRRRICSTLWADAYSAAGVELCPDVKYPTPGDLARSTHLRCVASR